MCSCAHTVHAHTRGRWEVHDASATLHCIALHYVLPCMHSAHTMPSPCMQVGARPPDGFCYRMLPCIVKTGDALLQEQFALQLVRDGIM